MQKKELVPTKRSNHEGLQVIDLFVLRGHDKIRRFTLQIETYCIIIIYFSSKADVMRKLTHKMYFQ